MLQGTTDVLIRPYRSVPYDGWWGHPPVSGFRARKACAALVFCPDFHFRPLNLFNLKQKSGVHAASADFATIFHDSVHTHSLDVYYSVRNLKLEDILLREFPHSLTHYYQNPSDNHQPINRSVLLDTTQRWVNLVLFPRLNLSAQSWWSVAVGF